MDPLRRQVNSAYIFFRSWNIPLLEQSDSINEIVTEIKSTNAGLTGKTFFSENNYLRSQGTSVFLLQLRCYLPISGFGLYSYYVNN